MSEIPDGFGQAVLNFDFIAGPSNPMAIVFGYSHAGFNPAGHAEVIADAWESEVMTGADISNNLLFKGVDATEDAAHLLGSDSRSVTGPSSDKSTLPQVAVLVRKISGLGGRANIGRMYMPGCTDATFEEGGFLLSAAQARLQEDFDNFLNSIEASDLPMHILHADGSALAPAEVISLSVQSVAATQRRRIR